MSVAQTEQPSGAADPWMTVAEAADYARVSRHTLLDNLRAGACQGAKVTDRPQGRWRVRRSWVDAWLESGRLPVGRPRGSTRRRR